MAGENKASASRRVCQLDDQIKRSHDRSSPATWTTAAGSLRNRPSTIDALRQLQTGCVPDKASLWSIAAGNPWQWNIALAL